MDQVILLYVLHLWILEVIFILQHFWKLTQIQHMGQPTHATTTPKSTKVRKKISSMFMPIIEAFDKNNKVIIDAMDQCQHKLAWDWQERDQVSWEDSQTTSQVFEGEGQEALQNL